jgi:hypothetical protein
MKWKEFIYQLVTEHCRAIGKSTFTLREFYDEYGTRIENFAKQPPKKNHRPKRKVEQVLQQLRDDGVLLFIDYEGTYRLHRHN